MADTGGSIVTNDEELRIVMVGKTGVGKSATGNTILGQLGHFDSKFSAESMTADCANGRAFIDQQNVSVVDTPGLFNTRFDDDRSFTALKQCVKFASPGPHVFLVVIRLGRFTEEERQTVQKVQEMFGQSADRYSMVLFTGGDQLEGPFENFLARSIDLQELVAKCNGHYHVLNNKSGSRTQVTELLQKIRGVVQENGGSHYTNQMFQEAEREAEAEKRRILKENEEKIRREREEMEREIQRKFQERLDRMMQMFHAERERERKEREEERKRGREMFEERRRELAEMQKESRKERDETQRIIAMMIERMRENFESRINEERSRFREHKEREEQRRAEKEMEMEEREGEWKREREEMMEERRREIEEMMEERRRELEERDEKRRREIEEIREEVRREREETARLMTATMDRMKEQQEGHLVEERRRRREQRREIDHLKNELSKRSECRIS